MEDLRNIGIRVHFDRTDNFTVGSSITRFVNLMPRCDFVLVVGTPGKYRLPNVKSLDARAEKELTFGRTRVALDVDVFNLLNSGTVLGRKYDVQADNFNAVTEIMNPRIVRFGIRFQF